MADWRPFEGVEKMAVGPVWVLRHDQSEHPEGGLRTPKVGRAQVVCHKRWRQPRLLDAQGVGALNLVKWPVLAWRPRQAAPEVPADWQKYLGAPDGPISSLSGGE